MAYLDVAGTWTVDIQGCLSQWFLNLSANQLGAPLWAAPALFSERFKKLLPNHAGAA
jgi:hypothetical protein